MTRKVFVFIAVFLSCLPACSSPLPTITQMPSAASAELAPFSPTPSPTGSPHPTSTQIPTATAAQLAPFSPTPSSTGSPLPASTQIPTATGAQLTPFSPTPSPTGSPLPTATDLPIATRTSHTDGVSIADITAAWVGEELRVNGEIVDASSFSDGFKFTIDDGTGQITLLTWLEAFDRIVGREGLRIGAVVKIIGEINQFEGDLEIVPAGGSDVVVVKPGNERAPERQTGSFTSADIGKRVNVEGEVVRAKTFSAGERVYLNDGSGQVLLLLWQNVFERIPDGRAARTAGSRLQVTGRIEEYQGNIEVVPALPFDVEIVMRATPAPPPPDNVVVDIGELGKNRIGENATVTGQVTDAASFSKGFQFILDDGTGQIVLLTWHNIYDELQKPEELNVGASVHITGEITEYEGELQIEPGDANEINVTNPARPPSLQQAIDTISGHLGQRVTIAGQVARVEETNSATRLFVADDSGEALVYIWKNIEERIPNNSLLREIGTHVRITGLVQEYRGELEIVPALPYDTEVLD